MNKKYLLKLWTLLGFLLAVPLAAFAQTEYGIRIDNVKVTSANYTNISASGGFPAVKSGQVTYDPATRTLTLFNAVIEASASVNTCIYVNGSDTYNLVLRGTQNRLKSYAAALSVNAQLVVTGFATGSESAVIESETDCGIFVADDREDNSLTLNGCRITAKGKWGISGRTATDETLIIKNATISATGTNGSICDFKAFSMTGCSIEKPEGAQWSDTKHAVCDRYGNVVTTEVVVAPVEEYGVRVGRVEVTSANYTNISASGGFPAVKSGQVTYNPSTKTLTLNNAVIEASGGVLCLYVHGKGDYTLLLQGTESRLSGSGYSPGLVAHTSLTITGTALLTESENHCGIYTETSSTSLGSITIDGCKVTAKGRWGIAGHDDVKESLTIKNATVSATGREGSICDFKTFSLTGCSILKPEGAQWNDEKHAVCDRNGNVVTTEVVIGPAEHYGISIGGVDVTSANYTNISASGGFPAVTNGQVSYNPSSKTLTLSNTVIRSSGTEPCVCISGSGTYSLVLRGNQTKLSAETSALMVDAQVIVSGTFGVFESKNDCGIYVPKGHALTIDGCMITARGRWGIAGRTGDNEALTINNSTVSATGTDGSICDFKSFSLTSCALVRPADALWNDEQHAVCGADGNVVTTEVLIVPLSSGIDDATTNVPPTVQGTYTTSGTKVATDFNQLPKGVYIVNGKKMVKQ